MNINPEVISLIEEIKNDKTHGASQLARQAAKVLKVAAEHSQADSVEQFLMEQKEIGQRLMSEQNYERRHEYGSILYEMPHQKGNEGC